MAILVAGCGNINYGPDFVSELQTSSFVSYPTDEVIVSESTNSEQEMKLVIKGKNIADKSYLNFNYEYHYAELPFIAILKELGAEVTWVDEKSVNVIINNETYLLNTEKCTFTEVNSVYNLFQTPPGEMHGVFCKVANNEFIIDSDSLQLLIVFKLGLKMNVDTDNMVVVIG